MSATRVENIGLPERYEVRTVIASRRMASVWCAYDAALGHKVAIKLLGPQCVGDEPAIRRFEDEARTAAQLCAHPHVAMIYDVAETAGRPYVVMEHLAGGTVADAIRVGAVRREEVLRWLAEAASAVDYAHGRGVVHGDIKPGNLLLSLDRALHVTDFGITPLPTDDPRTGSDQPLGAADYLSPERALGGPASDADDRYALAVVACELLGGERPLNAEADAAMAAQHLADGPQPASAGHRAPPPAVEAVLARGMAKRPEDRWTTASMFVSALEAAYSEPSPARAVTAAAAGRGRSAAVAASPAGRGRSTGAAASPGSRARSGAAAASPAGRERSAAAAASPASRGRSAAAAASPGSPARAVGAAASPARAVTAIAPGPRRRPRRSRRSVAIAAIAAVGVALGIVVAMPHGGTASRGQTSSTLARLSPRAPRRAHHASAKPKAVSSRGAAARGATSASHAARSTTTAEATPSGNGTSAAAVGATTTAVAPSASGTSPAAPSATGTTPASPSTTASPAAPSTTATSAAPSTSKPAAPATHASPTSPTPPAPQPASAAALEARGHDLMLNGAYSAAIPVLRQAISATSPRDINYAYALFDLGRSLRLAGDPAAAVPILERRLQIPNQTPVVRNELRLAQRADDHGGHTAGTATASTSGPRHPPVSHDGGATIRAPAH